MVDKESKIDLTQGKFAVIDRDDYELVSKYKWCAHKKRNGNYYAVTNVRDSSGGRRTLSMHELITGESGMDHRNGDGLDNRRANLRLATRSQNMYNRRINMNNTSGFKGVVWHDKANKWAARIKVNKRCMYLGLFVDKVEAAKVYDKAAIFYHGEFAVVNFREENYKRGSKNKRRVAKSSEVG